MKKLTFFVKNKLINIYVKETHNKHMYLKVDQDNKLIVLAPSNADEAIIKDFVLKHISKFDQYLNQAQNNILLSWKDHYVFYFGKKYPLKYIDNVERANVKLQPKAIWILTKDHNLPLQNQVLSQFLAKQLQDYLVKRQAHWETKMNIPQHKVKTVLKTSTWATNNLKTRSIIYSQLLIHYLPIVIDYVIIHELAHFHQPNHGQEFWNIVASFCPGFQELRNVLKKARIFNEDY